MVREMSVSSSALLRCQQVEAEARQRGTPPRGQETYDPGPKSIVDLFADFIRYLYDSTITHIKEVELIGEVLWDNFGPTVELVLSHPNGWEGQQQGIMRKAVIQAGIFSEEEARTRISFVTEGEASFNYCVTHTKSGGSLEVNVLAFLELTSVAFNVVVSRQGTKS